MGKKGRGGGQQRGKKSKGGNRQEALDPSVQLDTLPDAVEALASSKNAAVRASPPPHPPPKL